MFGVFDEDKSWQKSASLKYTINGYTDGTLPGTIKANVKGNLTLMKTEYYLSFLSKGTGMWRHGFTAFFRTCL